MSEFIKETLGIEGRMKILRRLAELDKEYKLLKQILASTYGGSLSVGSQGALGSKPKIESEQKANIVFKFISKNPGCFASGIRLKLKFNPNHSLRKLLNSDRIEAKGLKPRKYYVK
jgi:hypothetical protein